MPVLLVLLISLLGTVAAAPQGDAPPSDARFFAISYVEVTPSGRDAAVAAFKAFSEASRRQDGSVRFELFEQIGRPAHFAVVETWRDQTAFEGREPAIQQKLMAALQPGRVSGYDQRPYKALAIDPRPMARAAGAVSIVTHVDVSPDPRVAGMLTQLAEASRRDEGNVRFDVLQHTMRANHFTVIETWKSQKALDDHAAASHTRQYRDQLQPFTGSPLDERLYEQVE